MRLLWSNVDHSVLKVIKVKLHCAIRFLKHSHRLYIVSRFVCFTWFICFHTSHCLHFEYFQPCSIFFRITRFRNHATDAEDALFEYYNAIILFVYNHSINLTDYPIALQTTYLYHPSYGWPKLRLNCWPSSSASPSISLYFVRQRLFLCLTLTLNPKATNAWIITQSAVEKHTPKYKMTHVACWILTPKMPCYESNHCLTDGMAAVLMKSIIHWSGLSENGYWITTIQWTGPPKLKGGVALYCRR